MTERLRDPWADFDLSAGSLCASCLILKLAAPGVCQDQGKRRPRFLWINIGTSFGLWEFVV
jgi:hypothetical protein